MSKMAITPSSAEVGSRRNPLSNDLADYFRTRSLRTTEFKQKILHACRHLPESLRKPVRKTLWPPQLRHMRYVLPAVSLRQTTPDAWSFKLRNQSAEIVSRPLGELKNFTDRPSTVIATGPTANDFDWSTLADGRRLTWAVNGAPTMLGKRGLKCDFLVITDHRFSRDGADHIALAAEQGAVLLFSYEAAAGFAATRPEVLGRSRFHVFEKANGWYGLPALTTAELAAMNAGSGCPFALPEASGPQVGWSHDPSLGVFPGKTVPFAALQLIVWSGSRDIDIIGMDLGGKTRAYEEENPVVSHLEKDYQNFIRPSFQCMAEALAGSGVRIFNHSKTSPLPGHLVPDPPESP